MPGSTNTSNGMTVAWHIAQVAPMSIPAQSVNRLYSLGSRVHPTAYTIPKAGDLDEGIKSDLSTDKDGSVVFFVTPPIDPVRPAGWDGMVKGHSAAYLAFKRRKGLASS